METVLLTIPLKPFAIIPKIVLQQRNSASRHKKLEPLVKWASEVFYPLFLFYNSSESSESIHICKLPSRYNLAYSKGSSTANEVSAHSDPYVVFKSFSAPQQSIRSIYPTLMLFSFFHSITSSPLIIIFLIFFLFPHCKTASERFVI